MQSTARLLDTYHRVMRTTRSPMKIAEGAAYVVNKSLSPIEFLQRGAAFGLQVKERSLRGDCNPGGLWNDTSAFLMDEVCGNVMREGAEVANPFAAWPNKPYTMAEFPGPAGKGSAIAQPLYQSCHR